MDASEEVSKRVPAEVDEAREGQEGERLGQRGGVWEEIQDGPEHRSRGRDLWIRQKGHERIDEPADRRFDGGHDHADQRQQGPRPPLRWRQEPVSGENGGEQDER